MPEIAEASSKQCTKCMATKPLADFHKNKNSWDGRSVWCKACACAHRKKYGSTDAGRESSRRSNASEAGQAAQRRYRASENGQATERQYASRYNNSDEGRARTRRHQATSRYRDYQRDWKLRQQYGITREDELRMLAEQGNRCVICGASFEQVRSHIDHDHNTGAVRDILCCLCNQGLGQFRDNPDLLLNAWAYLQVHSEKGVSNA